MRVPLAVAARILRSGLDVAGIEERLTMTGTKVEAIHRHGVPSSEHFVVGRVLEAVQHPDADRLRVCTVDVGAAEPATIVCGAPNVAASQTVAVALPGAVMPGGMKIKRAKLRGVVSEGMILSEAELQIGPGGEGILVLDEFALDAEFAPGAPLAELLPIGMDVLELEITPNRPTASASTASRASSTRRAARRSRRHRGPRTRALPRASRSIRRAPSRSASSVPISAPASRRASLRTCRSDPPRRG